MMFDVIATFPYLSSLSTQLGVAHYFLGIMDPGSDQ